MKKYLMMGAVALLMGASFTSCSKDKDLYDPQANAMKFRTDIFLKYWKNLSMQNLCRERFIM